MKYRGLIFDLNGTMIDDMDYHVHAWYDILNDLGGSVSLEQTKLECYGKNSELLERIFPGRFNSEEKDIIGIKKETAYQIAFRPKLKLIPGLEEFLITAKAAHLKIAIGSAAIRSNIDFVIDGLDIRNFIDAIISADNVNISKPDPETFLKCADLLQINKIDCLVFEDSPKGVECAARAGMDCIVITTMHPSSDFAHFNNVIDFIEDYTQLHL